MSTVSRLPVRIPLTDGEHSTPTLCTVAGITYRQADYWDRTGLLSPSSRGPAGSGSLRAWTDQDLLTATALRQLVDAGLNLAACRTLVGRLHQPSPSGRFVVLTDGPVRIQIDLHAVRAHVDDALAALGAAS